MRPLVGHPARLRILVAAAVIIAYLPSLAGAFVWDDHALIEENPTLDDPLRPFTDVVYTPVLEGRSMNYRPILMASIGLAQALWPGPTVERVLSLAIHVAIVLLAMAILRALGAKDGWAAFGALLVGLHTGATEAAIWPSGRSDLLASFTFFLAWRAWLDDRDVASGVCLALLPFCKEIGVLAPLVAAVWMWGRGRISVPMGVGATVGSAGYLAARHWVGVTLPVSATAQDFVGAVGGIGERFLALAVTPGTADILVRYEPNPVVGALGIGVGVVLIGLSRGREGIAGMTAALLLLVPNALAAAHHGLVAERFFHLPLSACLVALATGLAHTRLPRVAWLVPVALGASTFDRAREWRSDEALFAASAERDPENPHLAFHDALILHLERNDCAAAIPLYRRGMEGEGRAAVGLLGCLVETQQLTEAIALGLELQASMPASPNPPSSLARAYVQQGDLAAADRWAREAVRRRPEAVRNVTLLGNIQGLRGDLDGAATTFARALAIDPTFQEARTGLELCAKARAAQSVR